MLEDLKAPISTKNGGPLGRGPQSLGFDKMLSYAVIFKAYLGPARGSENVLVKIN